MSTYTPITKHTVTLTSVQEGLYVFVFSNGRIAQVKSQRIHGILKDREEKNTLLNTHFENKHSNESLWKTLNPQFSPV